MTGRSAWMRYGVPSLLVLAALAVGAGGVQADESRDRLLVEAYIGEVINKFSAEARDNVLDPDNVEADDQIERFGGLAVDFLIGREKKDGFDFHFVASADHTARIIESRCEATDPECATDAGGNPIGNPEDFLKLVRDSSVLEWHAGGRVDYNRSDVTYYFKAAFGFVRSVDSGDDVVDDHFVGLGARYTDKESWFYGSSFEAGVGQTDFFATNRTGRKKIDGALVISKPKPNGEEPLINMFVEGYLDSDFGNDSDDIRIYLGVGFDVRALLKGIQGGA